MQVICDSLHMRLASIQQAVGHVQTSVARRSQLNATKSIRMPSRQTHALQHPACAMGAWQPGQLMQLHCADLQGALRLLLRPQQGCSHRVGRKDSAQPAWHRALRSDGAPSCSRLYLGRRRGECRSRLCWRGCGCSKAVGDAVAADGRDSVCSTQAVSA